MPTSDRPILICDAYNIFVRSWAAYPQLNANGEQMGGCIGFLKTLRRIVSEVQPSQVVIVWEGGGSARRRSLYAGYKLNRKPVKLNRFYGDDIPESEENKQHQLLTLLAMTKCIPACQVYVSDCEGDDTIAYLCRGPFRSISKVIVSSDKDLYQLLDDTTKLYSLHKKTFVTPIEVFEEFRVTAKNFAIAKSLCGDISDNVPGIRGLGFKTIAKLYPFLGTDADIVLQDIFDFSHTHLGESKAYKRVLDDIEDVKRNWRLLFLDGSMLSAEQVKLVDHVLENFKPKIDKMGLMRLLIRGGISDFDIEGFYYTFHCVSDMTYKTQEESE